MKWIKRLGLGLLAVVVLLLLLGLTWEQISRVRADGAFDPPGRLIDVGDRTAHLYCVGEGSPTVILEAGLDAFGTQAWGLVQPALAELTRVCSYDRAGIMWSDPGPRPRDAHRVADELEALLTAGAESPPWVMVGHSLGGIYQLVYDTRHPGEIAGFVFVDASHPRQLEALPGEMLEVMEDETPSPLLVRALARLGVVRLVGLGPGNPLPEELQAASTALTPRSLAAVMAEMQAIETIAAQGADAGSLGSRPVMVLTAGLHPLPPDAGLDDRVQAEMDSVWSDLQRDLAARSTDSEWRVLADHGHYLQLEAPDDVVDGIRDVVLAVREGRKLGEVRAETGGGV